jgi:hypothetical protein
MTSSVSIRDTRRDSGAPCGPKAPRPGWQGSVPGGAMRAPAGRHADAIAVARELAEEKG